MSLHVLETKSPPIIQKPNNPDDINELIQYQQLYDLYVTDESYNLQHQATNKTQEILDKIYNDNNNRAKTITINNTMIDIIKWVRENIPKWNKQKWDWVDSIIEKSWQIINQNEKYGNKQKKARKTKKRRKCK